MGIKIEGPHPHDLPPVQGTAVKAVDDFVEITLFVVTDITIPTPVYARMSLETAVALRSSLAPAITAAANNLLLPRDK